MIEVVETLMAREPASMAYTSIGTMRVYRPIWTGRLAIVA